MINSATKKIGSGIDAKFQDLINDTKNRISDLKLDTSYVKEKLERDLPGNVETISQFLLSDLINLLMESSKKNLEHFPNEFKDEFYEMDLRKKMKKNFTIKKNSIKYSLSGGFEFDFSPMNSSSCSSHIGIPLFGIATIGSIVLTKITFAIILYKILSYLKIKHDREFLFNTVERHLVDAKKIVELELEKIENLFVNDVDALKTKFMQEGEKSNE